MRANYTVILGLGKTGVSCLRYLRQQNVALIAFDTRSTLPELDELKQEFSDIPIHLGALDESLLLQAQEIIISPGLSLDLPALVKARHAGIPILGDIELFARAAKAPIVGITGTNAKGTVTTLLGNMLQAAGKYVLVGGNIGTPALDLLYETTPDYYVLELSSFQLETTEKLPLAAGTILNISEDHLDRHGTLNNYIAAKQRIYRDCRAAIYNLDDAETAPLSETIKKISFSLSTPAPEQFGLLYREGESWLSYGDKPLLKTAELRIKGRHNWSNALAALALGKALQLPVSAMLAALREFNGLPHRCEWIKEKNNIAWINDSKGTNVGSTTAALQGIGPTINGKIVLIAGGLGKGADFSPLYAPVQQYVREVILFGQDAARMIATLKGATHLTQVNDLQAAVVAAQKTAQSGDTVLLSPACASWDMFNNYAERGELFRELVQNIQ